MDGRRGRARRGNVRAPCAAIESACAEARPGSCVVGEAATGEEAWGRVCELRPDVLLLDLSMAGMDGTEAAARVVRDCPEVRILVLTMHEERSYVVRLLGLGRWATSSSARRRRSSCAPSTPSPLVNASSIPRSSASRRLATGAPLHHLTGRHVASEEVDAAHVLTQRPLDILRRVACGNSNAEIAAALALETSDVGREKVIAMRPLGLQSRAALVRYASARGWRD